MLLNFKGNIVDLEEGIKIFSQQLGYFISENGSRVHVIKGNSYLEVTEKNFDSFDLKFGGLTARIETAIVRLSLFIDGKINTVEELEEERLMYWGENVSPEKPLVGVGRHADIAKASV